ncbi:hypothetical protein PR202_gb21863 [Eleusine coracana subsp. coracana]|uniref:Uncharacterized protein n=1 Tax=Eleusine coracana subsp. coracana TaxID=191504 RepID=A0AAV5FE91_ELECO|nr:hypothetical protein PR202_gb21863 [Eleusine coracana subsp. coracana]
MMRWAYLMSAAILHRAPFRSAPARAGTTSETVGVAAAFTARAPHRLAARKVHRVQAARQQVKGNVACPTSTASPPCKSAVARALFASPPSPGPRSPHRSTISGDREPRDGCLLHETDLRARRGVLLRLRARRTSSPATSAGRGGSACLAQIRAAQNERVVVASATTYSDAEGVSRHHVAHCSVPPLFSFVRALTGQSKGRLEKNSRTPRYSSGSLPVGGEMSFFFRASRLRPSPQELVRSIKESFVALDTKTGAKALEDVEKNVLTLRQTLSGDGEVEPNQEQVLQIALEICKEGVLSLFVQNLPSLGWEGRKDLVHCWCILLRQKVDESYCCVQYIESHVDLLDFLVVCNELLVTRQLALFYYLQTCSFRYILESSSFELFFQYVELPNFDIASDALNTFKVHRILYLQDLLTKHEDAVAEFLSSHYEQFFGLYTRLLSSTNYVTRRQSVKVRLKYIAISSRTLEKDAENSFFLLPVSLRVSLGGPKCSNNEAIHFGSSYLSIMIGLLKILNDASNIILLWIQAKISGYVPSTFLRFIFAAWMQVFVANPNKPRDIIQVLVDNHREVLKLLHNLPTGKGTYVFPSLTIGGEDEQLDEERDLIIKEIEKLVRLSV